MKAMTYSEIRQDGVGFYAVLVFGALLAAIGLFAFIHLEHVGHYVTGMNNQVVWGLPHVFAIFMIVAASGAANMGSLGTVFGKKAYVPLGRSSVVLAVALLLGGLLILVLDLGHADRLIVAMTTYNFKSIFAWNILLYNGFLLVMGFYLWTMMDRIKLAKALYKPAGYLAFVWRILLTMGTGSIFGFLVARQYYDAAIMAPLFIALSYVLGSALYILMIMFSFKATGRKIGDHILNRMRYSLAIFIAAVFFFELVRHLTNLYATEHHGVEAYILTSGSLYTQLFWYGYMGLGVLLPLFLIWCRMLRNNRLALVVAALLAAIGGFAQLYVIIIGGQAFPLVLFPNADVSSAFADGIINPYTPSMYELALGIGGIGVVILVVAMGMKSLRLLPDSLQDEHVAPDSAVK